MSTFPNLAQIMQEMRSTNVTGIQPLWRRPLSRLRDEKDVHIETFFITGVLSSALPTSPPRLPDSISYLTFPLECKTC
jgi:hypothetical protein